MHGNFCGRQSFCYNLHIVYQTQVKFVSQLVIAAILVRLSAASQYVGYTATSSWHGSRPLRRYPLLTPWYLARIGLLCVSLRSSWSPASPICQTSSTVSSTSSPQHFRDPCISVAGPTVWNLLPDHLRDPAVDSEQFRRDLKTYLFAGHSKR